MDSIPDIRNGGVQLVSPRLTANLIQTNNIITQQEVVRQNQEIARQNNTAIAITNIENAIADSENATAEAIEVTSTANEAIVNINETNTNVQNAENIRQNYYNAYKVNETYNDLTTYYLANKVIYNGSSFQCIVPSTVGNYPNSDGTDNTQWKCIARKGSDGTGGDMFKIQYDTNNNGIVDNAEKVNGHTVEKDVPADALFTDTIYIHPTSGVVIGTYKKVKVDIDGHVTEGFNPTASETLTDLGITATVTELNCVDGVTENIQIQLDNRATKSTKTTATLAYGSWVGSTAPFTYTMSVTGVTSTNNVEILPNGVLTTDQVTAMVNAIITSGTQTTNSITLYAYGSLPTIDLPITIIVRGDI